MSECNRGVWQLGHANVLLMFFSGLVAASAVPPPVWICSHKVIQRFLLAFFFFFGLLPDKYSTRWLLIPFCGRVGETLPDFVCGDLVWGVSYGDKVRRPVHGSNDNPQRERENRMLRALLFLEIRSSWAHAAHIGRMEPQMGGSDKAQP